MFKSLYSGVSGLSANLTNLDVIGNNIANSNTVGFKSGRVTFNEMLAQTLQSASRPVSGGLGGVNPQQVGLGTRVGSIDTNFNQGNFETTGNKTDLAIQGNGFFILSDGVSRTYTRAGVFGLDSANYLVSPSTGLKVQGVMADSAGVIGSGPMEDLYIDPGLVVPAQPSTTVQLMGNLDASADAKATIMEGRSFLAAADAADLLLSLNGNTQGPLGLNQGDRVRINGQTMGAALTANTFEIQADSSYQDLVDWLNAEMTAANHSGVNFSLGPNGALQVANGSAAALDGLSLSVTGNTPFNANFVFDASVPAAGTSMTSELRAYADGSDTLATLYDGSGNPLDIDLDTGSAVLLIGGSVGSDNIAERRVTVTAATTLADLAQELQFALGAHSTPATVNEMGQTGGHRRGGHRRGHQRDHPGRGGPHQHGARERVQLRADPAGHRPEDLHRGHHGLRLPRRRAHGQLQLREGRRHERVDLAGGARGQRADPHRRHRPGHLLRHRRHQQLHLRRPVRRR